jgi:protocatechuate 3,4-dioxygenase beta subunit
MSHKTSRRNLLKGAGASAALAPMPGWVHGRQLESTPACRDEDEVTPSETAGPFYKPRSPHRTSLIEPGDSARRMRLSGRVLSGRCEPIAGALIDIWHADASGKYDLQGYRYRGHLFSDADGAYTIATIVPGIYEGRTRHIHVRVQPPSRAILTTQLYFPREKANAWDGLFDRALLMHTAADAAILTATFDFVLRV